MIQQLNNDRPIIGESPEIQIALDMSIKAALTDFAVFLLGERGTGKELFARFIHKNSSRADKPFLAINCASLPENMMDSELFGIEDKTATGVKARPGIFEAANGGTVFLDEIGDMPYVAQSKILRVLQERELTRIGGRKTIPVDMRIIAATNKMEKINDDAVFRADLFDRLNEISITLPPLRERSEDIMLILKHFLGKYGVTPQMTKPTRSLLEAYSWPGNVRELETIAKRIVAFAGEKSELTESDLLRIHPDMKIGTPPVAEKAKELQTKDICLTFQETDRYKNLMEYLGSKSKISCFEYQKIFSVSASTALRDLRELVESGILTKMGNARAAKYVINY